MDAERVLALRYARSGLAARSTGVLSEAAACPASDFQRDAALLALAARAEGVTRERYDAAVDDGELVVAFVMRAAIHAMAPPDLPVWGRPLIPPGLEDVDEVAAAVADALGGGRRLDKRALHEALRHRLPARLLPWCRGCGSHHAPPVLWRYACVRAGVVFDAQRRLRTTRTGRAPAPGEPARRFLRFYAPARLGDFAAFAGLTSAQARPIWDARGEGADALDDAAPEPKGLRLVPPGDPFLQKPNRELVAPDPGLRKRLFRPVASPGVVLLDGRVAGTWRLRKGEVEVERLVRSRLPGLDDEIGRVLAAVS